MISAAYALNSLLSVLSTPTGLSPNLPIEISPGWDGDQPLA